MLATHLLLESRPEILLGCVCVCLCMCMQVVHVCKYVCKYVVINVMVNLVNVVGRIMTPKDFMS